MSKEYLVEAIMTEQGYTRKEAEKAVGVVFSGLKYALWNKGVVNLMSFGKFEVRHREDRHGVNPNTGEPMIIEARNVVHFKAGKGLKDVIQKRKIKK